MKSIMTVFSLFLALQASVYGQGYTYEDLGANLPAGPGAILVDMSWISSSEGWICSANSGEIYHTSNGGAGFVTQVASTSTFVSAIYMLNAQEGFATGDQARVMYTNDGGNIWQSHWYAASPFLALDFPPGSSSGYACGYSGWIFKVSASGISSYSTPYSSRTLQDISFPADHNGWVCGNSIIGHYAGTSGWVNDQLFPAGNYNAIYMVNTTTGWAVGDGGLIVKTVDGISWTAQNNPDGLLRNLNDVCFLDGQTGLAVGDSGVILKTSDGGATWTLETGFQTTRKLNAVRFPVPATGYIAGDSATLIKVTGQPIGVGDLVSGTSGPALSFLPNPATDHSAVEITIPKSGHVLVRLYDISGRLIITLLDKEVPAGAFTIPCETMRIPRGVYECRMESSAGSNTALLIVR